MKVHGHAALFLSSLALFAVTACGPKPEPEPPPPPPGPSPEELAQAHEMKLMPYREVAQKFNDGVWKLDVEQFKQSVTYETHDLFIERTQLEMVLADEEGVATDETFLKKQADYKIIYYIKDIDLDTGIAAVEGMVEGNVEFESTLKFVTEDGQIKIDHTDVLAPAVAQLEAAVERKKALAELADKFGTVVADHNVALADGNAEMFEGTVTARSAELAVKYLQLLPKKEGGNKKATIADWVKYKKSKVAKLEIKEVDPENMTAVLIVHPVVPKKLKKGEEAPQPSEMTFHFADENGKILIDCAPMLEEKIAELEGGDEAGTE